MGSIVVQWKPGVVMCACLVVAGCTLTTYARRKGLGENALGCDFFSVF
jgi:hypothetical protein